MTTDKTFESYFKNPQTFYYWLGDLCEFHYLRGFRHIDEYEASRLLTFLVKNRNWQIEAGDRVGIYPGKIDHA